MSFRKIVFGLGNISFDFVFLFRVAGFFQVGFHFFDFLRHGNDFVLHPRDPPLFDAGAGRLRGDDFNARRPGTGIGLVALVVVPVKVRVDDVFHGLIRHLLDLFDEAARRRRLGVGIDDQDTVIKKNNGGVAVYLVGGLGDGSVHSLRNRLDFEQVIGQAGSRKEQKNRGPCCSPGEASHRILLLRS